MSGPRIASLCSGYEGLGMAVQAVLGGELAFVADNDPGAAKILAYHYPDVPNLGDITTIDWASAGPVDILTAGFPCTDVSCAGVRAGLRAGTRSGVWTHCARAISELRPSLVVIENVRGLLSAGADSPMESCPWCLGEAGDEHALRAAGAVLGDLADLGYDAEWATVSAADAGAPHRRERVFIVARPAADTANGGRNALNDGSEPRAHDPASLDWCAGVAGDDRGGHLAATDTERDRPQGGGAATRSHTGRQTTPSVGCGSSISGPVAENADRATGRERRIAAPGQAQGGRSRADACGSGRASVAADTEGERHGNAGPQGQRGIPAAAVAGSPADATRDGRDARGPESAGLVGGSDAAVGGHGSASDTDGGGRGSAESQDAPRQPDADRIASAHADLPRREGPEPTRRQLMPARGATPDTDGRRWGTEPGQQRGLRPAEHQPGDFTWGNYAPAVHRWEAVTGRPAPRPTEPGRTGERLSPRFVEWMMGLPEGWVTDVPGLTRNAQLKALGNGVVPAQAAMALRLLLARTETAAAA